MSCLMELGNLMRDVKNHSISGGRESKDNLIQPLHFIAEEMKIQTEDMTSLRSYNSFETHLE